MGDFDKEFSSMTDLLASNLEELKAENARLVEQVKRLEQENRTLEELDEINTRAMGDWNRQVSVLQAQVETLKDVLRVIYSAR